MLWFVMIKLIENLKVSIFVSILIKNLLMYSWFDMFKFGCVNGCMLFIFYYRVNWIGENWNFEIFINLIFFIEIKKVNKVFEILLV